MHESVMQFWGYVRGIWRYRWYALSLAWFLALVGWAVVFRLPDQYEASARVHVDTESELQPLLRGLTVGSDQDRRLQYMTRSLFTRPNLEKIARMADLDLRARTPEDMEATIQRLSEGITLSGTGEVNIYEVTYTNSQPEVAKRVVRSVVSLMAERTLGQSRQSSDRAKAFLDRQVEEYEKRLEKAEERLMQFKRKHVGQMPNERGDYFGRLQEQMEKLEQARMQLQSAQSRRRELERLMEGEKPVFGIMGADSGGASGPSPLQARIQNLQSRLDQLQLSYTDKHPQVQALKGTIADLKAKQKQQRQAAAASGSPGAAPLDTNPVYQKLRSNLAETKAAIASLEEKVRQYRTQVKSLREKVDTIPKVEAQLARLNRDYRTTKNQYERLLERREKASISEKMQESSEQMKVEVIDPPHVPSEPAAPNRPMLASIALVAALGGGGTGAFLLAQARPVYENRHRLFQATGYPVFGTISMVWSRRMRIRRHLGVLLFLLGLVGLIAAYGAVLAFSLVDPEGGMALAGRGWGMLQGIWGKVL